MNFRRLLLLLFGRTRWSAVVLIIPICHFIAGCYFIRWGMTEPDHMAARGWEHLSEVGIVLCIVAFLATLDVRLFVWLLVAPYIFTAVAGLKTITTDEPISLLLAPGWAIFVTAVVTSMLRHEIWHWKECRKKPEALHAA